MPFRTALPGKDADVRKLRSTRIDARATSPSELLQIWELTRALRETACLSCACAGLPSPTCAAAASCKNAFKSLQRAMSILKLLLVRPWLWLEAPDLGNPPWRAV